jgi:hypothetical protein
MSSKTNSVPICYFGSKWSTAILGKDDGVKTEQYPFLNKINMKNNYQNITLEKQHYKVPLGNIGSVFPHKS